MGTIILKKLWKRFSVLVNEKLRDMLDKKEIIGNIKKNPCNGDAMNEKYFDNKLYKRIFKIEKANEWLDDCKALFVRFEHLI